MSLGLPLTFSAHLRIWEVLLLAALLGVINAFDIPARDLSRGRRAVLELAAIAQGRSAR